MHAIESEARELLATALAATTHLLAEHRLMLDQVVEALMAKATLEKSELAALPRRRGTGPTSSDEAGALIEAR